MAACSAAAASVRLVGTDLHLGNAILQLAKARSFWTRNGPIHVRCQNGPHETIIQILLATNEQRQECIRALMSNEAWQANLFDVKKVKPIVSDEDADGQCTATIGFQFDSETERNAFVEYALKLIPAHTLMNIVEWGDFLRATVILKEKGSKKDQMARIKAIFERIMERFGPESLNEALEKLKDREFPPNPHRVAEKMP